MKRRKILILLSSIVMLSCIGILIFAAIKDAIIENHTITLDSNILKVSKSDGGFTDYVEYSNGDTIYVDNYENGYDLIAVSNDNSDGFVITTNQNSKSYTITETSKFNEGTTYYIIAVLYHSFNSYVDNFYDLELLNNEYRHNVVNDDLNIGNVTDFYNIGGEYIGNNEFYNISNGLYDYKKNPIKSITNGITTYTSSTGVYENDTIDLTKYHRNDFYDASGNLITTTSNITLINTQVEGTNPEVYFSGYYDAYKRKIDHIYYVDDNKKEWNLVFTEQGIVTNGIKNNPNQPTTIDLATSYYDNGIVVDDAYNSKTFRNIYILKDFETVNDLTLIMPCNIHLLNNHITLNDNITLKHYYHSTYKIDTMAIGSSTGGFIQENSKQLISICPNATIKYNGTEINATSGMVVKGENNLLNDVIEFAEGYFVDYILKDKFYQVYELDENNNPIAKRAVSYDSINLVDGLYTLVDAVLTPKETITDNDGTTYTLTYTNNLITKIENDKNSDVYDITYVDNENNKIKEIKKNNELFEDRNVYIDISNQAEYYTLFLTNPVLPKNFYDEDVTIKYTYKSGGDFYVTAADENQKVDITITVTNNKAIDPQDKTASKNVSAWIMGKNQQAIADTIALKLECDINKGFSRNSTSRMYINYDTIDEIINKKPITFDAMNNINVSDVYLEVKSPEVSNNSINVYTYDESEDKYNLTNNFNSSTTYYEKYMLIERVSYSLSDGFAELELTLTDGGDYKKIIYAQLPRISEEKYIEIIKSEIGQIFFGGNNTEYQLPKLSDLQKYDVSQVTYTPVILTNGKYETVNGVFSISNDYVMTNNTASATNEYRLKVNLVLKDGQSVEFYTDKIALTTTTTGGDGENDYQSSLFEKDFNEISTFIGLSNDFYLEGNVYFYLEMTNDNAEGNQIKNNGNTYLGLYSKITNYDTSDTKLLDGNHFYIDPNSTNLTKVYVTQASQLASKPALYTNPSDADEVVGKNYKMVFLTDSEYIPTDSTTVKVKAYITDSSTLSTAKDLKDQAAAASSINLYQGLYDANGNPIYEITNGNKTYILEYDYALSDGYSVSNVYEKVVNNQDITFNHINEDINISGYYCNGYVFYEAAEGKKLYISNGLYNSKYITANSIKNYTYDKITFTIDYPTYNKDITSDYQKYGPARITSVIIDMTGNDVYKDKSGNIITASNYDLSNGIYDTSGNPITKFTFDDSSFNLTYDDDNNCTGYEVNYTGYSGTDKRYYRLPAQQTTFYKKNDNGEYTILTIYAQDYSFTVPGIYKPNDFNWNGSDHINKTGEFLTDGDTYDLYGKLMELYGFDNGDGNYGFKEINGKNYFLLVEYLEDAIKFGNSIITYSEPTAYYSTTTYYEKSGEEGSYTYTSVRSDIVDEDNYQNYYVVSNVEYVPIDCGGKYVYIKDLEKCPNLEGIYITNAKFGEATEKVYLMDGHEFKEYTSQTDLGNGLTMYAGPYVYDNDEKQNKNYVTIESANETVNDITYTSRLKFNGGPDFKTGVRYLSLDISGNTKTLIQIVLKSQNSNKNRDLGIADSIDTSAGTAHEVGRLTSSKGSGTANIESFLYEGNSTTLYLYPRSGNPSAIYAIYVYNITSNNDTLATSGLKNTLKELYLDNIIGISGTSYDFSNYKQIERLTIKNSKLVTMPTLYRRIVDLDLSNNIIQDISNITSGVNLENVNLSNNLIKTFEPLRSFKTLKSLYLAGNNSNALAVVGGNDMFLYGIPRTITDENNNQSYRGNINVCNLIQVCDNNPTLNATNTDFYSYIYTDTAQNANAGNNYYLYAAYTANAISYSYTHNGGLKIDLALLEKNGYTTAVYVSSDTANYTALTKGNSSQYNYTGYFSTDDTSYKYVLIAITKNGYTAYREIYITTQ